MHKSLRHNIVHTICGKPTTSKFLCEYKNIEINELKFNFDDILIISKSLISSQYSDQVVLGDRSNLIYYLLSIKYVLKKIYFYLEFQIYFAMQISHYS